MDDVNPAEQPDDSVIKFSCAECGQHISVPIIHAGKKGKCPKCNSTVVIPGRENSDIDSLLFDLPPKNNVQDQAASSAGLAEDVRKLEEKLGIAKKPESAPQRKFPWPVDIFLYPLNLAGIIHLICLWLLVFLLCPLIMEFWGLGTEFIPVVYTLPVAYVMYYFVECIRDSATGNFRAPDFWMHPNEDKWDCISRLFTVLGCIAVYFCPTSVYYIVTERADLIFWVFLACGSFFSPMALLAVVYYDSFYGLNPILILKPIFRTFLPYCGMVLLFCGGALLLIKINPHSDPFHLLPAVPLICRALQLYLMFVAAGLLGSFYWRYKDKLDWDV